MRLALKAARLGRGSTHPNPRVGAVAVRAGRCLGVGSHFACGERHAEAALLAAAGPGALEGATVYVTLEPCAHEGRTPPCAPALVDARIGRLVAAIGDPHPLVSGRGLAILRGAGIPVETGVCAAPAAALNAPFLWRLRGGRPLVTLKIAASLDGRQAAQDRSSQWISSEASRLRVHQWRAAADAMLTGLGTLTDDLPRLTARPGRDPLARLRRAAAAGCPPPAWPRQPARVVADSRARSGSDDRLLEHLAGSPGGRWIVACGARAPREAIARLSGRGVEVWVLPEGHGGSGVDLAALADRLAERGFLEVMAECGPTLSNALLRERLVGRVRLVVAPLLLGGEWTWTREIGVGTLPEGLRLGPLRVTRAGPDLLVEAWESRVEACLEEAASAARGEAAGRSGDAESGARVTLAGGEACSPA